MGFKIKLWKVVTILMAFQTTGSNSPAADRAPIDARKACVYRKLFPVYWG